MACPVAEAPRPQCRSPVPVFLRPPEGQRSAGMALLSAAESRCSQCPAPAKAGAAFLPRGLKHRWASDLGVEAHASWWFREGSGMARSRAASCALLCRICASLVAKAAGTETMGTVEMGQEALLPRPLSRAPSGLLVLIPHARRSQGPLLPSSSIIPGHSFPTVISCGENDSLESPISNCYRGGSGQWGAHCPEGTQHGQTKRCHLLGQPGASDSLLRRSARPLLRELRSSV